MQALADRLNALCDAQPFETGWYVKDLSTGATAHRYGDVVVSSASTRKVAILMTALRAVHAGRLSLTQPVVMQAKHQISTSGCFQYFLPGFTLPLRDVLVMMIIVSDNTCTGTVVEMVGLDAINEFSRSVGMVGTVHRQPVPANVDLAAAERRSDAPPDLSRLNVTTPADVGRLLELILEGTRDPRSRRGARMQPRAVPARARHSQLAADAAAPAAAASRRGHGGAQDRHRRPQLQRRGDRVRGATGRCSF